MNGSVVLSHSVTETMNRFQDVARSRALRLCFIRVKTCVDGGIFKETILTWYFVWLGNTFGRSENDNDDDDDDKQNENNFVNPAYRFID